MVAAKIANMRQGARTDLELPANLPEVSQSEAADLLNVGERSVRSARQVLDSGTSSQKVPTQEVLNLQLWIGYDPLMKHNVDILYVGALNDRISALAGEVMSIPVDPVGTFPYQEMLRTLKERARILYEDE